LKGTAFLDPRITKALAEDSVAYPDDDPGVDGFNARIRRAAAANKVIVLITNLIHCPIDRVLSLRREHGVPCTPRSAALKTSLRDLFARRANRSTFSNRSIGELKNVRFSRPEYDSAHQPRSAEDADSGRTRWQFDGRGRVATISAMTRGAPRPASGKRWICRWTERAQDGR